MSAFLELVGYMAAALTTFSFLPQAWLTLRTRNTAALSLSMYSMFTAGVFCWMIYGIYIEDLALALANVVTLLLASPILGLKLLHTFRPARPIAAVAVQRLAVDEA